MYIRDVGVVFDSKLCLHHHVGYTLYRSIKMLEVERTLTYFLSTAGWLLLLYCSSVRPTLDYGSLTGITLPVLMPIRWNASSSSRQLCTSVVFSYSSLRLFL